MQHKRFLEVWGKLVQTDSSSSSSSLSMGSSSSSSSSSSSGSLIPAADAEGFQISEEDKFDAVVFNYAVSNKRVADMTKIKYNLCI